MNPEAELSVSTIRELAKEVRDALVRTRLEQIISLQDFPAGSCGDASLLLGEYLFEHGQGEWTYVSRGRRSGSQSHAWIEKNGLIVDITADQFDDVDDEVIVTEDPTWHGQFASDEIVAHRARIGYYKDRGIGSLTKAYRIMKGDISSRS
jgi:hypothetical protein